jgi:hypothetical protein
LNQVEIFPVPSSDVLNVNIGHEVLNSTTYSIYTTEGQLVQSGKIQSSKQQLNIANLASGVYVLQIQDAGSLAKKDFIKL